MSTKELTRAQLVEQSFDCCMLCVWSWGPPLSKHDRHDLLMSMEHFKTLALRDIGKEDD